MKGSPLVRACSALLAPCTRPKVVLAGLAGLLLAVACLSAGPPPASAFVAGDELWRRVHNGPGHGGDKPNALAVAPGGAAVYVAGDVTGSGGLTSDLALVKYRAGGTRDWVRTWDSPAHDNDRASAVVCDASGNVYVGGSRLNAAGMDFLLIKYSPSGVRRWVRTWDGPGHYDDAIAALGVDAKGNVYAAGFAYVSATGIDAALVKWTPTGKRAWAKTYSSDGHDRFERVVVDKARGRVYAGGVDGTTSGTNWLLARYGVTGKRLWASPVGDPNTYFSTEALALTPGGAVLMAGGSNTGSAATNNGRLGRWTAAGDFVWSTAFYGSAGDYDIINDVAVDREGNVAVVGTAKQFADNFDGFVVVYRPDKTTRASKYVGDVFDDSLTAVAFDARGNVYATGSLGMTSGSTQFWTQKFSLGLVARWQKVKKLSGAVSNDHPTDIAVRGGDFPGVYVTGTAVSGAGGWDWLTLKYKP